MSLSLKLFSFYALKTSMRNAARSHFKVKINFTRRRREVLPCKSEAQSEFAHAKAWIRRQRSMLEYRGQFVDAGVTAWYVAGWNSRHIHIHARAGCDVREQLLIARACTVRFQFKAWHLGLPAFCQFVCNKTRACRKLIRGFSYNKECLDLSSREEEWVGAWSKRPPQRLHFATFRDGPGQCSEILW